MMGLITIERADDPRLSHYQNPRDRDLARGGELFVAESELVVRRMIAAGLEVVSILAIHRKAGALAELVAQDIPVYTAAPDVLHEVMGFKFHSGVLGVGRRPVNRALADIVPRTGACGVVIVPDSNNTENLGLILRVASGFGVDLILLGERCCDPYYRQAIRVSMGNVFHLNIVRSNDLERDMTALKHEWNVERFATVLDAAAEPLGSVVPPARWALAFGNEAQGLEDRWIQRCDRRVVIPMKQGTDSLNLAVAAGIFLYHFSRTP